MPKKQRPASFRLDWKHRIQATILRVWLIGETIKKNQKSIGDCSRILRFKSQNRDVNTVLEPKFQSTIFRPLGYKIILIYDSKGRQSLNYSTKDL